MNRGVFLAHSHQTVFSRQGASPHLGGKPGKPHSDRDHFKKPLQEVSKYSSLTVSPAVGSSPQDGVSLICRRVGVVHSVKLLSSKRCAFINFEQRESCVEAIRRFHVSSALHHCVAAGPSAGVLLLSCWCTCLCVEVLALGLDHLIK